MRNFVRFALASIFVSGVALSAGTPAATAWTCSDGYTDLGGGLYLDVRHLADEESIYSVWLFLENGIQSGLQRGGTQVAFAVSGIADPGIGETDNDCPQSEASDYIIF